MTSQPISFSVAFGWVCTTPDTEDTPFVIGPFTDKPEATIWRTAIRTTLVEDLRVLGGTMIFYPDSYTEISGAISRARSRDADDGAANHDTPTGGPPTRRLVRSYVHHRSAWWHDANAATLHRHGLVDEVTIQVHDDRDQLLGEFAIVWTDYPVAAQLRVFDDAWPAFLTCTDLVSELAGRGFVGPSALCRLLDLLGVTNSTPTEPPLG